MPKEDYSGKGLSNRYKSEFNAWVDMRKRCYRPKDQRYADYGGRGIQVCERWRTSFRAFLEDMGPKPKGYSIERRNNDGNYCPENCYWATREQQQRNRRNTHLITYQGQTRCLTEWAQIFGLHPMILTNRLKRGWPIEEALSFKPGQRWGKEVLFTKDGKTLRLGQWAKLLGIRLDLIIERRARGWDLERAIFTPPGPNGKKKTEAKG